VWRGAPCRARPGRRRDRPRPGGGTLMRLFVGVVPPEGVLDAIERLARPDRPGVRWTRRQQWHVTLRFLGEVDDPDPVAAALDAAPLAPCDARVGPAVRTLGHHVL